MSTTNLKFSSHHISRSVWDHFIYKSSWKTTSILVWSSPNICMQSCYTHFWKAYFSQQNACLHVIFTRMHFNAHLTLALCTFVHINWLGNCFAKFWEMQNLKGSHILFHEAQIRCSLPLKCKIAFECELNKIYSILRCSLVYI